MGNLINPSLEFFEVVNTFPVLKDKLSKLHFNISDLREGESISDYFGRRKRLQDFEINIVIKKLNHELKLFLNTDKTPQFIHEYSSPEHDYLDDGEEDDEEVLEEEEEEE
ncbi:MAG: hypothetical protein KC589_02250 [Nanoarchaeota archaeon]|nr:hypothetical protein [Nanoarchaeota archaeon]